LAKAEMMSYLAGKMEMPSLAAMAMTKSSAATEMTRSAVVLAMILLARAAVQTL